jgi:hypothetical protein
VKSAFGGLRVSGGNIDPAQGICASCGDTGAVMMTISMTRQRRAQRAAWRVAVAWLLLLTMLAAPLVQAACALGHAAPASLEAVSAGPRASADPATGHAFADVNGCCIDELRARPADQGGAAPVSSGSLSSALDVPPLARTAPQAQRDAVDLLPRQHPLPPYEPVMNRVRRLLI